MEAIKTEKEGIICEAAEILLRNVHRRWPLNEEIVAAAMLDPAIQHIEAIQNWLESQNQTR